jgi:hypothetical protein
VNSVVAMKVSRKGGTAGPSLLPLLLTRLAEMKDVRIQMLRNIAFDNLQGRVRVSRNMPVSNTARHAAH